MPNFGFNPDGMICLHKGSIHPLAFWALAHIVPNLFYHMLPEKSGAKLVKGLIPPKVPSCGSSMAAFDDPCLVLKAMNTDSPILVSFSLG